MSQRTTRPPRQPDDDRPSVAPGVGRRRVLHGGVAAVGLALAGCLDRSSPGSDDGDDPDRERTAESADGNDRDSLESELTAVIDAYLEAAADEDLDAIDDVTHSLNPLNPADLVENGWEFRGGDGDAAGEYDATVVTEDGSVDDILELEGAKGWFSETDLEAEIGDEKIAVVELDGDDETIVHREHYLPDSDDETSAAAGANSDTE
ncbi:hypothetical protein [Halopiger djelfimassiliensis]|uniref:hypothetical protein n=1 Tax=Halopiger djelfimassiliensis TaxID=1293047 RepID=UPI0006776267|nr:hypothetical protein [Halopiger djelfimassiliensis]